MKNYRTQAGQPVRAAAASAFIETKGPASLQALFHLRSRQSAPRMDVFDGPIQLNIRAGLHGGFVVEHLDVGRHAS